MAFFLMNNGGLSNPAASIIFSVMMLIPAFSVIVSQFFTKEGIKNKYLKLNFRENAGKYLVSYFLMQILIILGAVAFFCVFPKNFDRSLTSLSDMILQETGTRPSTSNLYSLMAVQLSFAFISGPIVNILFAFGEEYGWRGYLFPHLSEYMSPLSSAFITGIIWGLWHAPMIVMGYNYGTEYKFFPITGIFAMIIFCISVGIIFSYFTYKTESIFPSVLMHSAINAFSSSGVLFYNSNTPNPFIGPAPTGIIGGSAFIIFSIICAFLLRKESKKCQKE